MFILLYTLISLNLIVLWDILAPLLVVLLNLQILIGSIPTPYIFSEPINGYDIDENNIEFEIVDEPKTTMEQIMDECMSEGSNLTIADLEIVFQRAESKDSDQDSIDESDQDSVDNLRYYDYYPGNSQEDIMIHLEEACREIELLEDIFRESDKINNNYYLGYCNLYYDKDQKESDLLLSIAIQSSTFYNYHIAEVAYYLHLYETAYTKEPIRKLSIMKLDIHPTKCGEFIVYSVIVKTHWLRLVQRHWKKIYAERSKIIEKRALPESQLYKEITGVYPPQIYSLPGLKGMMSHYNTKPIIEPVEEPTYEIVNMPQDCMVDGVMP